MALSDHDVRIAAKLRSKDRMGDAGRLLGTSAFRMSAIIVAVFVLASAAVVGVLFAQSNALMTEQILRTLTQERSRFAEIDRSGGPDALLRATEAQISPPSTGGTLLLLQDANRRKRAGNIDTWPLEFADKPQGGAFIYANNAPAAGLVLPMSDGSRLLIGRDLQDQRSLAERLRWMFLAAFGFLSVIGLLGGLVSSRWVLRRVGQITETGEDIVSGDLSRRIPLSGRDDEFDHLSRHLNAMLARIEQLMNGMREVSDNIAHDLKTPLSRLRSRAEAALRSPAGSSAQVDGLSRVIEDADAIIQTFNALLLIARLEAGAVESSAEVFDLAALVHDVLELYEPVAEEAGQSIVAAATVPIEVRANRQLISQALANLIDNAIKYGGLEAGQSGEVNIQLQDAGKLIELSVGDRGAGIPAKDRERVRERFVRLDRSRSQPGTGLGLSLVAAVARLHGGEMRLEDNGPGLRVVLVLPRSLAIASGARP